MKWEKGSQLIECIIYIALTAIVSLILVSITNTIGDGMWQIIQKLHDK